MEPVRLNVKGNSFAREAIMVQSSKIVSFMGTKIMGYGKFLRDAGGALYVYQTGRYVPNGERTIRLAYADLLNLWEYNSSWNAVKAKDVVTYIRDHVEDIWDAEGSDNYINLLNGVWDINTNSMKSSPTPDWKSTLQIPITYDPNATCPQWDKFLSEVCNVGSDLLVEIIGLCMTTNMNIQSSIVLVGSGSNGKSTFLKGLRAAIGEDNVGHVPLHALADPKDRFSRAGLVGKLVNLFGDISMESLKDPSYLKAIIGQDPIVVETKYQMPYAYIPYSKLIFSSNHGRLKTKDETYGFTRKFLYVPFNQKFPINPAKQQELDAALSTPEELSGLFNRISPKLQSLLTNGFTMSDEVRELLASLDKVETDNEDEIPTHTILPDNVTLMWLYDRLEVSEGDTLATRPLYEEYCTDFPGTLVSVNVFSQYITTAFIEDAKRGTFRLENGKQVKGFRNIRRKGESPAP